MQKLEWMYMEKASQPVIFLQGMSGSGVSIPETGAIIQFCFLSVFLGFFCFFRRLVGGS